MTGTAVKNAAAVLTNLTPNAGKSAKSAAAPGGLEFQAIWDSRMGKGAQNAAGLGIGKPVQDAVSGPKKPEQQPGSRDNARTDESAGQDGPIRQDGAQETGEDIKSPVDGQRPAEADRVSGAQQEQPEDTGELSPEELETAMEVLSTAVMELMRDIADTFGISMEELNGTLEELGMEPLDLLQQAGMGEIVLKLGGAEDSLALLTDETLCADYKALMEQMTEVLNETAEDLGLDPKQLQTLLNERPAPEKEESAAQRDQSFDEKIPDVRPADETVDKTVSRRSEEPGIKWDSRTAEPDLTVQDRTGGAADKPESSDDKGNGGAKSEKDADSGQPGNLFAQEFRPLQPEADVQQVQGAAQSASWSADTQDIMRQIMDYMKLELNADTTNLEMQLHPASLGTIHIQVEAKAGVITASFITQNEAVKAALESQIVQLKENFEEQGVKVEAIEVMVQSHAFERNLEQGREQNPGGNEPSRRARVRRINLNDLPAVEDMEEEDALAADMLAAGGSTVDYTV